MKVQVQNCQKKLDNYLIDQGTNINVMEKKSFISTKDFRKFPESHNI